MNRFVSKTKTTEKGFGSIAVIFVVLIMAVIAGFGLYAHNQYTVNDEDSTTNQHANGRTQVRNFSVLLPEGSDVDNLDLDNDYYNVMSIESDREYGFIKTRLEIEREQRGPATYNFAVDQEPIVLGDSITADMIIQRLPPQPFSEAVPLIVKAASIDDIEIPDSGEYLYITVSMFATREPTEDEKMEFLEEAQSFIDSIKFN